MVFALVLSNATPACIIEAGSQGCLERFLNMIVSAWVKEWVLVLRVDQCTVAGSVMCVLQTDWLWLSRTAGK